MRVEGVRTLLIDVKVELDGSFPILFVEDYKADVGGEVRSNLEAEITALKGERKKSGASFAELEKRVSDLAKANTALSRKVGEMEVAEKTLSDRVQELEGRFREVEKERDEERNKRHSLDRQVEGMDSSYKLIVEENENLKREVWKILPILWAMVMEDVIVG
ncbi:uncharacterized protein LOC141697669 [Apium graveolens]|uniref:uncharacterized protein LOC141697669 n=1 Tax=Apium graveolens TaxID=4045 RepID=UPI003D7ADE13